jgi:CRISPR-associated protein Csb2
MRAFQALVNAASLRHRGRPLPSEVESALSAIEAIRPSILAPNAEPAVVGHRAYVPHNQADLVSSAWDRGNLEASIASHRVEKDIRPIRIAQSGDSIPELHYLYPLGPSVGDAKKLLEVIRPCMRSISALGWGIDQVVADATLLTEQGDPSPKGERWQPASSGQHRVRVHRAGSLVALRRRHARFMDRLVEGRFTPVPPLTAVDVVRYSRGSEPSPRPYAIFKLLDPNEDPARYPHAKLIHIAGMTRHVAIQAMLKDPPPWIPESERAEWVNRVVRGKREAGSELPHQQMSYIPLPSIGSTHADGILRNVMLVGPVGMDREVAYLAERMKNEALKPEGDFEECTTDSSPTDTYRAELRLFTPPEGKFIDTHYLGTSHIWQTVTPVILPGHNDKKDDKTRELIQRSLQQAGIETPCEFTWQSRPFFKNCLSAHKYDRDGRHTGCRLQRPPIPRRPRPILRFRLRAQCPRASRTLRPTHRPHQPQRRPDPLRRPRSGPQSAGQRNNRHRQAVPSDNPGDRGIVIPKRARQRGNQPSLPSRTLWQVITYG